MQIPQDIPVYKILDEHGFYGSDDRLYLAGEIITLEDEPNEDMEPMNALARERLQAYLDKLDGFAKLAAEKHGRAFVGRARTLDAAITMATQDARRVQLVKGDGGIPIMGGKKRGPKPRMIMNETPPETSARAPGKLSLAMTEG